MTDIDLDRPETYSTLDPGDMFRRVNDLAEQIENAWDIALQITLPESYRSAANVVIAGMGGSAIGGSLLESYGRDQIPVPVTVWREYGIPAYVNERTLLIVMSYSGNTEETLSAMRAARERGAMIACVTTGGEVNRLASEWNLPAVRFQYPAQPRATLGYLLTPLLAIFEQLGFLGSQQIAVSEGVDAARTAREQWGGDAPTDRNLAKALAQRCAERVVVVYGAEYLGAVARRWKTQLNENAKNWGFFEEYSELNHNAIVGYEYPASFLGAVRVLVLHGSHQSERIRRRMDVTDGLMEQYGVPHERIEAPSGGVLAEMVSLIALGDYLTYYLALINGADPTVIEPIDHLKAALASS